MYTSLTRFAHKSALKLNKHSPKILFWSGLVGITSAAILSSRATLKAAPVVQNHLETRDHIERTRMNGLYESERVYKSNILTNYRITGTALFKLYGPSVALGVASVAALTKSHHILTSRNAGLSLAYAAASNALENYRARVRDELGEEQDQKFLVGTIKEIQTTATKNGGSKTREVEVLDPTATNPYLFLFDVSTTQAWDKDPGYNASFLDNQQQWANHLLKTRGVLFLNEVLELLKLPKTPIGQLAGWVYESDEGDGFVDFGHSKHPEFVSGNERSVWLDFNVQGNVMEAI